MRLGFVLLTAILVACGGGSSSGSDGRAFIDASGGTVSFDGGAVVLEIPAGALSQRTEIRISDGSTEDVPREIRDVADIGRVVTLEPDGLQFAKPVTLRMRLGTASSDGADSGLPVFISKSGDAIELLRAQSLDMDLDAGTTTLSGELTHFSKVWDNLPKGAKIRVRFSGIPDRWTVGPPFQVTITVSRGEGAAIVVEEFTYDDRSEIPIGITSEEAGRFIFGHEPGVEDFEIAGGEIKIIRYDYKCGSPGKGKYRGVLTFKRNNDLERLLLLLASEGKASVRPDEYISRAERNIDCVAETGAQPTAGSTSTATATATPTATPTPMPTPFPPTPMQTPFPPTPMLASPTPQVAAVPTVQIINVATTNILRSYLNCTEAFIAGNPPINTTFTGSGVWTFTLTSPTQFAISTGGGFSGTYDSPSNTLAMTRIDSATISRHKVGSFNADLTRATGTTRIVTLLSTASGTQECTMTFEEQIEVVGDTLRIR